jgi:hypothetical protein
MSRQTRVQVEYPGAEPDAIAIEEWWTVLTHEMGDEYWSEVLDSHRHTQVRHDVYGFDSVEKYFGDTPQESRREALDALRRRVGEKGGRIGTIGEMEE